MDPFTESLSKLAELGFFKFFLPWLLITTVIYALLKKTKILGTSSLINGTISLIVGFFILYYPIVTGQNPGPVYSAFIMQTAIFFLVFMLGVVGAGIFYPDLSAVLKEKMTSRNIMFIFVVITIVTFITSGMLNLYLKSAVGGKTTQSQKTVYTIVAGLILMVVLLVIGSYVASYAAKRGM